MRPGDRAARAHGALAPATHIARRFRGPSTRLGLPAISLLGPRFSGKSQTLQDVHGLLAKRKTDVTSAVPVLIDLEELGHVADDELTRRLASRLKADRAIQSSDAARASEMDQIASCLREIGRVNERGTVLLVDHLDAVSASFARGVVRSFRVAFDQRDVFPEYRRIGVVFAGSASLSLLRRAGESAFVTEFLVLPSTPRAVQLGGVRKHWPRHTELPAEVAAYVAAASGGERVFVELLVEALGSASEAHAIGVDDIDRAICRLCHELSSDIFRELTLALLLDGDLYDLVKEVLRRGERQVERRDIAPDIDLFSLSGALVLASDGGAMSARYAFRNEIVRSFVSCLQQWREHRDSRAPSPAVAAIVEEFDGIWRSLGSSPRIWSAVKVVGELWSLLTGSRAEPEDVQLRVVPHERATPAYWLSSRTNTVTVEGALRPWPATESAVRGAIEGREGVPCVASDDARICVAGATTNEHARLVVAVTLATRNVLRIREHTIALWQRALDSSSKALTMSALAEIARYIIANPDHRVAPDDVSVLNGQPSTDRHVNGGGRATLELGAIRTLSQRLAAVGFSTGRQPGEFVAEFLDRSELPDVWKREVSGRAAGSFDDATWYLIRLLLEKGAIPDSDGYSALAVVLVANAERFGLEDLKLICRVIHDLQNPRDLPLLESIERLSVSG
jgi:hypothetical protein